MKGTHHPQPPSDYAPTALSMAQCPVCAEMVAWDHKLAMRVGIDDKGAWVRHPHQPKGQYVTDNFSRELALQKKKPLTRRDFRS